jgi:glycosyltransferase involved in cell wall biosynthesis
VDLVISTSHCAAKAVVPTGRARHICYCHSPMRYAWDQFESYFATERLGVVGHAAARHVLAWLARWDRATAGRVDRFLANSAHVAGRIGRYYNRRASVLYPPVDTTFFTPGDHAPNRYFLVVSALVPYKRIETAIRAAGTLNRPLRIVGSGPDEPRLRAMAGPTVEFSGSLEGPALLDAYRQAIALVLPGEEDFGIAPVEALACGRPVVALGRGGATETVEDATGVLVGDTSVDAFAEAMASVERRTFDSALLRSRAERFSISRFDAGFRQVLTETLTGTAGC